MNHISNNKGHGEGFQSLGVLRLEAKLHVWLAPTPQLNWTLLPFLISSSTFFLERFLLLLIVYLSIDPLIWTLKLGYTSLSICCHGRLFLRLGSNWLAS